VPRPPARLAAPKTPDVKIDFDNIGQRILAMPLPPRRYVALQPGKAGVLFAVEAPLPLPANRRRSPFIGMT
jgi:hypothetical protein